MPRVDMPDRERKPSIEAEEYAFGNAVSWRSLLDTFHKFRRFVTGLGTEYDDALDRMRDMIPAADSLLNLTRRTRREHRKLEKRLNLQLAARAARTRRAASGRDIHKDDRRSRRDKKRSR